jgi:hypothetical protein
MIKDFLPILDCFESEARNNLAMTRGTEQQQVVGDRHGERSEERGVRSWIFIPSFIPSNLRFITSFLD